METFFRDWRTEYRTLKLRPTICAGFHDGIGVFRFHTGWKLGRTACFPHFRIFGPHRRSAGEINWDGDRNTFHQNRAFGRRATNVVDSGSGDIDQKSSGIVGRFVGGSTSRIRRFLRARDVWRERCALKEITFLWYCKILICSGETTSSTGFVRLRTEVFRRLHFFGGHFWNCEIRCFRAANAEKEISERDGEDD